MHVERLALLWIGWNDPLFHNQERIWPQEQTQNGTAAGVLILLNLVINKRSLVVESDFLNLHHNPTCFFIRNNLKLPLFRGVTVPFFNGTLGLTLSPGNANLPFFHLEFIPQTTKIEVYFSYDASQALPLISLLPLFSYWNLCSFKKFNLQILILACDSFPLPSCI